MWPCNVRFPAKSYTASVELLWPTSYGFKLTKYNVPFHAADHSVTIKGDYDITRASDAGNGTL